MKIQLWLPHALPWVEYAVIPNHFLFCSNFTNGEMEVRGS